MSTVTDSELATWEKKLRYELEDAIREAGRDVRANGKMPGHFIVQWDSQAFEESVV